MLYYLLALAFWLLELCNFGANHAIYTFWNCMCLFQSAQFCKKNKISTKSSHQKPSYVFFWQYDGPPTFIYRVFCLTGAPLNCLSTRLHVNCLRISLSARDCKAICAWQIKGGSSKKNLQFTLHYTILGFCRNYLQK